MSYSLDWRCEACERPNQHDFVVGNDGHELVTAFQEVAYSGTAAANTRLQFLAPEDSRSISFVSSPDQSLSVDLSTDPREEGFSSAVGNPVQYRVS